MNQPGGELGGAERRKAWLLLHLMMLLYAGSTVLSKLAAGEEPLSVPFLLYYAGEIVLLGAYALGWQQVIKHVPLSTAYANKAITVVWGILWGALLFQERVTWGKIVGAVIVLAGVVLYSGADYDREC